MRAITDNFLRKRFERILTIANAKNLINIDYLNLNNIFFSGLHGFSHSSETALYVVSSYLNENRNSCTICLLLFIVFQKAIDLVNSYKHPR